MWATTSFVGFHRWPDAPDIVGHLRVRHRHRFHVRGEIEVTHPDRDVEFQLLQASMNGAIVRLKEERDTSTWSCEHWAEALITECNLDRCEVSEDGENGAIVSCQ